MNKYYLRFLELIGLAKVTRFKQIKIFELNRNSSILEIKNIFSSAPYDAQFCFKCPNFDEFNIEAKEPLIQRVENDNENFYICYSVPFGITTWEKKHIDFIVETISQLIKKNYTHLEHWRLLTRAIEGKSFGEY
jgi:hypothetical protein